MPPSCSSTSLPLRPLSSSPIPHTRTLLSLVNAESPDLHTIFIFSCRASLSFRPLSSGSRVYTWCILPLLFWCTVTLKHSKLEHRIWAFPPPMYPANHARAKQGVGVSSVSSVASAGKTDRRHGSIRLLFFPGTL
jgi:hypothetical protein